MGHLLGGGLAAPLWLSGILLAATATVFLPITRRWERTQPQPADAEATT